MGYIDAHVHVWTDDLEAYPLAEGFTAEQMNPPTFPPEELLSHARPCGVDRIVLIQMSYYRFDNGYMLDTIDRMPETFRGVAVVDHTSATLSHDLAALHAGGVRGLRVYQLTGGDDAALDADAFRPLCAIAGGLGIAVCPLVDAELLPVVGRAVASHPQTTFVIDHLARIGAGKPIDDAEIDALCALAKYPNVCVKVSAFYARGDGRDDHADLIPLIRRVWEAFGADRLMWATDCPFQVQHGTYEGSISLVRDRLPFLSEAETAAILEGTAASVFFSD